MPPSYDRTAQTPSIRLWVLVEPLGDSLGLAVIAVVNGVVREAILVPRGGVYSGHVLSTGLLIAAIFLVTYPYFDLGSVAFTRLEFLLVGILWSVLTVDFEFVVGFPEGTPIAVTVAKYDLFGGQVWAFVPLTLLVSPLFFGTLSSEY